MTLQEHSSTRELIATIEQKDRQFRIAQSIFMAILLLSLLAVVGVQLRTLSGVQEQLRQQGVLLEEQRKNTEDIKNTTANVSRQLDCIAQFFAQRDRQDAVITDLEQCVIVNEDGSIIELVPLRPPAAATDPQPAPEQSAQAETIDPDSPGLTPLNPQQPADPTAPGPEPVDPPVEILGIPACVPFTDICVR